MLPLYNAVRCNREAGFVYRSASPPSLRIVQLNASFVTLHVQSSYLAIRGEQMFGQFKVHDEPAAFNRLRTGLLNCLNARSRGLTFTHRASCI